jgi:N-acetylglucosamine-6-phosphate deacetylase
MLLRGRHYRTLQWLEIHLDQGRIASVAGMQEAPTASAVETLIAPAYFDLQINGALGVSFTSETLSEPEIHVVIDACRARGIGSFCPTVITARRETLLAALGALAGACDASSTASKAMPAIHLEGPFISPEDGPRGAHPSEHVRLPDWDEFQSLQQAAGGRIGLVTLAPELPGAIAFIERLAGAGIVVALGHSAATPEVIRDAISAGARLSTHLGNGCPRFLPRHDNLIWEQLASDQLWASVIADGHHLPTSLLRCLVHCKSMQRLILTCDASPLAGVSPGRYVLWGQEVAVLPKGKIVLPEQNVMAGSWMFTHGCVEHFVQTIGIPYEQAHLLAADQPRRLLGLSVPTLEPGQPAELVLLRRDRHGILRHLQVVREGKLMNFPAPAPPGGAGEC